MNQSKLFAIAAAAAVMVSCGNEDGGGSTPLTPEENKEKLDRIGMDVIGMINPVNHEDFCEAVDHFVEFSDEGNLGDVFHDPNAYSLMASTMQALKTACTKGDISGLLTKTEVTDYIYRAEDYYGVYNYRNGRWTYTEDDSKLEFRYSFNGKRPLSLIRTGGLNLDMRIGTAIIILARSMRTIMRYMSLKKWRSMLPRMGKASPPLQLIRTAR